MENNYTWESGSGNNNSNIFKLTDIQQAYWTGRNVEAELGGISCHAYLELDGNISNSKKLEQAFYELIKRHEILRMKIVDNKNAQIFSSNLNNKFNLIDLRNLASNEVYVALQQLRNNISHRMLDVANGEVFGATLVLLPNDFITGITSRLLVDCDLIAADVKSLSILLQDWASIYNDEPLKNIDAFSFAKYLSLKEQSNKDYLNDDMAYWQEEAKTSPIGPELPLKQNNITDDSLNSQVTFKRRRFTLSQEKWQNLKNYVTKLGITPAMLLATIYASVINKWSTKRQFLINMPLFDRADLLPGTFEAVSDFSNLVLLKCDFSKNDTFINIAKQIQSNFHEAVKHSSVSGVTVQQSIARAQNISGLVAPIVFACNLNTPLPDDSSAKVLGNLSYMISQTPQTALDHQVYEANGELITAWDERQDVLETNVVAQMFEVYEKTLNMIAKNPDLLLQNINISLSSETIASREAINNTSWNIPTTLWNNGLIHERIFTNAKTNPSDTALIFEHQTISYGDLCNSALRVGGLLRS